MDDEKRKKHNEKSRRWRESNPEKHREAVRKSRERRIERLGKQTVLAEHAKNQRNRRLEKGDEVRAYERKSKLRNRPAWMLKQVKARAKAKGLAFDIQIEDLADLPENCPVFGFPLDYNRDKAGYNSPTIDRINNDQGYVKGNIIVVSRKANTMKSDGTVEDMLSLYNFYRNLYGNR